MNLRALAVMMMAMNAGIFPAMADNHAASAHKAIQPSKPCSIYEYKEAMEKMHKSMVINYTGDTDIDFAAGMIPHHQGAIDMAKVELTYGKDPTMRWLARWIIQAQETEIGMMRSWLNGRINASAPTKQTPQVDAYEAAMENMHHAMMIDYTGDADIDFARGMIPHHQGAIDMATVELESGKNSEIHKLASDIINSQQQEIGIMKRWLDSHAPASLVSEKHSVKTHHH